MTTLIRYQPWALFNELNRAFPPAGERAAGIDAAGTGWAPAVDIEEYADRFVLTADVPGVDQASVDVTLEKGVLTLSGIRETAAENAAATRRRSERGSGRFTRRFSLPDTVDTDAVSARSSNGVLEVVIPKRPAVQPRKITVTH